MTRHEFVFLVRDFTSTAHVLFSMNAYLFALAIWHKNLHRIILDLRCLLSVTDAVIR